MYSSVLVVLLDINVDLSHASKSRILAAAWGRRDHILAEHLLSLKKTFQLPEVVRAIRILDTPRKIRQLEKKYQKTKSKKKSKFRSKINELIVEVPENCLVSVSGSLSKRVKKWVNEIPKNQLEFYALHLPKELWKELSDIIHFSPKDFNLDYFLSNCFGSEAPKDSIVSICSDKNNLKDTLKLVSKYEIPYSYLRKNVVNISKEVKIQIVSYETIDTILWWYEEFISSGGVNEIDSIISKRLSKNEIPTLPYGKLMERMLYFYNNNASFYEKLIPIAENRLKEIQLELEQPVVVLGDASFSMDVAIRTSTIISSILSAVCDAELKFFNVESFSPKIIPKTAIDVLKVTSITKTDGLTAPACTLMEYYKKKKKVKLFVMVTDEIENVKFDGTYFSQLFYKYYKEIYPSRIVMVSFLENLQEKGRMVKALESFGINPIQFILDSKRPDLTKLDKLLGLLCSETNFFIKKSQSVSNSIKKNNNFKDALKLKLNEKKEKLINEEEDDDIQIFQNLKISNKKDEEIIQPKIEQSKEPLSQDEKKEKLEEYKLCQICMEREKNTVLGCGHLFCDDCLSLLNENECPTCRKEITTQMKVYL